MIFSQLLYVHLFNFNVSKKNQLFCCEDQDNRRRERPRWRWCVDINSLYIIGREYLMVCPCLLLVYSNLYMLIYIDYPMYTSRGSYLIEEDPLTIFIPPVDTVYNNNMNAVVYCIIITHLISNWLLAINIQYIWMHVH